MARIIILPIYRTGANRFFLALLFTAAILFLILLLPFFVRYCSIAQADSNSQSSFCEPLDPQAYSCDLTVSTGTELKNAVSNSAGNETICLENGTYAVGNMFIWVPNLTIRGKSGDREAVVIDNNYQSSQSIFSVRADHVTIGDLTLKRSWYHPVHVSGGGHFVLLHNLHIIDGREQFIKVNNNGNQRNDNGTLSCSMLELTDSGRTYIEDNPTSSSLQCYTGGIDALTTANWVVRDNIFKNIYCRNGHLPTHMVLFWKNASNPVVERNLIVNCARGIGFGLGTSQGHSGGIIRNNMVYDNGSINGTFDVGIGVENGTNVEVYNNTVYTGHYFNSIEYRFNTTGSKIYNNISNKNIASRNGGSADLQSNISSAQDSWFADLVNGDLHLASNITEVVDQGIDIASVTSDFDGELRPSGSYDIGADEYNGISVALQDVIMVLQIATGSAIDMSELQLTDINNDQQIGVAEAMYGLQLLANEGN